MFLHVVSYQHPFNDYIEDTSVFTYLWATMFGPLWYAYKGMWFWALVIACISFYLILMTEGAWYAFIASYFLSGILSRLLADVHYQRHGWKRLQGIH